jgi:phosphomannomutase
MIIPLKLAEILVKTGRKVSELVDELPQFPKARENLECDDKLKFELIRILADRLADEYGADRVNRMDGLRIDLNEDGWVLIRASNTSPLIRVTVEGATDAIMDKMMKEFVTVTEDAIKSFKKK